MGINRVRRELIGWELIGVEFDRVGFNRVGINRLGIVRGWKLLVLRKLDKNAKLFRCLIFVDSSSFKLKC